MRPGQRTFLQGLSEAERIALLAQVDARPVEAASSIGSSRGNQPDLDHARQIINRERERRQQLETQVSSLHGALKTHSLQLEEARHQLVRNDERAVRLAAQLSSLEQENAALSAKLLAASNERSQLVSKLDTMRTRILELQQGYVSMATCAEDGVERRDLLRRRQLGGLMRDAAGTGFLLEALDIDQPAGPERHALNKTVGGALAAVTRERDALQQRVQELSGRLAEAVSREAAARGAQALRSASWKRSAVQAEARLAAALKRVKELSDELRKRDKEARQRDKYTAQLERTVMAQHKSLQQQRRMLEAGVAPAPPPGGREAAGPSGHHTAKDTHNAPPMAAPPRGSGSATTTTAGVGAGTSAVPGAGVRFAWYDDDADLADLAKVLRAHGGDQQPHDPFDDVLQPPHQQPSQQQQQPPCSSGEAGRGLQSDVAAVLRRLAEGRSLAGETEAWMQPPFGPGDAPQLGRASRGSDPASGHPDGTRGGLGVGSWSGRLDGTAGAEAAPGEAGLGSVYNSQQQQHARSSSPPPAVLQQQLTCVEESLAQLYRDLEEFKDSSLQQHHSPRQQERPCDPGSPASDRSRPASPSLSAPVSPGAVGGDSAGEDGLASARSGPGGCGSFAFAAASPPRAPWSPPGSPGSPGSRTRPGGSIQRPASRAGSAAAASIAGSCGGGEGSRQAGGTQLRPGKLGVPFAGSVSGGSTRPGSPLGCTRSAPGSAQEPGTSAPPSRAGSDRHVGLTATGVSAARRLGTGLTAQPATSSPSSMHGGFDSRSHGPEHDGLGADRSAGPTQMRPSDRAGSGVGQQVAVGSGSRSHTGGSGGQASAGMGAPQQGGAAQPAGWYGDHAQRTAPPRTVQAEVDGGEEVDEEDQPRRPLPTHMLGHILRCSHHQHQHHHQQRQQPQPYSCGSRPTKSPQAAAARGRPAHAPRDGSGGCGSAAATKHRTGTAGSSALHSGGPSPVPSPAPLRSGPRGRATGTRILSRPGYSEQQQRRQLGTASGPGSPYVRKSSRSRSPAGISTPGSARSPASGATTPTARERGERGPRGSLSEPVDAPGPAPQVDAFRSGPPQVLDAASAPWPSPPAHCGEQRPTVPALFAEPRPDRHDDPAPLSPEIPSPISTLLANLIGPPQTESVTAPSVHDAADEGGDLRHCSDQRKFPRAPPDVADRGLEPRDSLASCGASGSTAGRPGAKRRPYDDVTDGADDRRKTRGSSGGGAGAIERGGSGGCGGRESDGNRSKTGSVRSSGVEGETAEHCSSMGGRSQAAPLLVQGPGSGRVPVADLPWQTGPRSASAQDADGDVLEEPGSARSSFSSQRAIPPPWGTAAARLRQHGQLLPQPTAPEPGARPGSASQSNTASLARPSLAGWLQEQQQRSDALAAVSASEASEADSASWAAAPGGTQAARQGSGGGAAALQRLRDKRLQRMNAPGRQEPGGEAGVMVLTLRGSLHGEVVVSPRVVTPRGPGDVSSPEELEAAGACRPDGRADAGEVTLRLELNGRKPLGGQQVPASQEAIIGERYCGTGAAEPVYKGHEGGSALLPPEAATGATGEGEDKETGGSLPGLQKPQSLMQLLGQASEDLQILSERLRPLVDNTS